MLAKCEAERYIVGRARRGPGGHQHGPGTARDLSGWVFRGHFNRVIGLKALVEPIRRQKEAFREVNNLIAAPLSKLGAPKSCDRGGEASDLRHERFELLQAHVRGQAGLSGASLGSFHTLEEATEAWHPPLRRRRGESRQGEAEGHHGGLHVRLVPQEGDDSEALRDLFPHWAT